MELPDYVNLVRRYWRSIVATALVVLGLATAASFVQQRMWTSTASLYIAVESGGNAGELSQGATYAERQVKSFVEVATSPYVLQPVIEELGLNITPAALAKNLTVVAPLNTSVIAISVQAETPEQAAERANAAAASLARAVDQLSPQGSRDERLVQATVIQPASPAERPTSPRILQYVLIGLLLGVLLGLAQALARDKLNTRVRSAEDIAQITNTPLIGAISRYQQTPHTSGYSPTDEAFRTLRTNLSFLGLAGERRPSIVLTSSIASEGKTETAIRLAKTLAQAGEKVLLVDADLRRPQVAARMGLEGAAGLSHALSGQATAWELLQPGEVNGLDVLAAGAVPPNPAELLASDAMQAFLRLAEDRYDYVILDSPPLLPVTDAAVLASAAGGAIVVARSRVVSQQELATGLYSLSSAGATVIGIVLNDSLPEDGVASHSSSYYYHQHSPTTEEAIPEIPEASPAPQN